MNKVLKECLICKQTIKRSQKNRKYCSRSCYRIAHFREKNCELCKTIFTGQPARINKKRFCSSVCRNKSQIGKSSAKQFYKIATEEEKVDRLRYLFEQSVIKKTNNECWGWKKSLNIDGYPKLRWNNKDLRGNRVSWMIHFGEITEGMQINHSCDTRSCCAPHHLFLGTQKDNIRDMFNKKRDDVSKRIGENNAGSKLTNEQVKEIKTMFKNGISLHEVTIKMGIKKTTISDIRQNRTWKHITID